MNTLLIQIGNKIFQREAVCRVEYVKAEGEGGMFNVTSALHIYMIDGKDFTIFNDDANTLWEVLKSSALQIS